jgi:hypothetical protein
MTAEVKVRSWIKASDDDIRSGLLGWISVEFGPLILDGICLRRSAEGRFLLSFPARTDRSGRRHSYIRPADDDARRAIERTILAQLGQRDDAHAEVADG